MTDIVKVQTTNLVVKANKLIEARYKFTLWEMRVFTSMVSLIKPQDVDFEYCKLYIKDLMKFYNSSSKEDYETIRRVPVSLSKKQLELMYIGKEGKRRWANVTLFPTVTRPADDDFKNAYIELKFNEELKPLLLALKDKYRIYDIKNIIPLRSVYSIRLFELLKQYENTKAKSRKFEVSYLKEMLGLTETEDEFKDRIKRLRGEAKERAIKKGKNEKYPLYADFKKRVLKKAQKDLQKHCDITFSFDEIKEGRKVVALKFHIQKNNTKQLNERKKYDTSVTNIKTTTNSKIFERLYPMASKWLSKTAFKKLLSEYPEEQIKNAIQLTLNRLKKGDVITNVAGHIISMAKQKVVLNSVDEKKQRAREKKEVKARIEAQKEKLNIQLKQLSKEWSNKEQEIVDNIFSEKPDMKAIILEKTKSNKYSQYNPEKTYEENLASPLFKAAFRSAIKKEFPMKFEAVKSKYEPKIKFIKKQLISF